MRRPPASFCIALPCRRKKIRAIVMPPLRTRFSCLALPAIPVALASASSAHAQILYTSLGSGVSVDRGHRLYFNLNPTGGEAIAGTSDFAGADFHLRFYLNDPALPLLSTAANFGNTTNGILQDGSGFVTRLNHGDAVSSSGTFSNGGSLHAVYFTYYGNNPAWVAGSGSGYIGLSLSGSGNTYYGWARVSYDDASIANAAMTLYDFAINTTAFAPINAGQGAAIPEPSDTAVVVGLAALLAGSAAHWRRRKPAPAHPGSGVPSVPPVSDNA